MFQLWRKWKAYATTLLNMKFNSKANPEVQLQQAIEESARDHEQLALTATQVGKTAKNAQAELFRLMEDETKAARSLNQAVSMAEAAKAAGDTDKEEKYNASALTFAKTRKSLLERIEAAKVFVEGAIKASDAAKKAYRQNADRHIAKLDRKRQLLGQLAQAKMQEQLNAAMHKLSLTVGSDVPTMDEIGEKIQDRYAAAAARAELEEGSFENVSAEIEAAAADQDAQVMVEAVRTQLQLNAGESAGNKS